MENCIKFIVLSLLILAPAIGFSQLGIASYYSDDFHGRTTASGEKYDKTAYTAAHKELPFGTMVRVTRLDNKRSVTVKVNDRGPYIKGRIIDLSKSAAEKLDMVRDGSVKVKVEVVNGFTPSALPTDIASTLPPAPNPNTSVAVEKKTSPTTVATPAPKKAEPAKVQPKMATVTKTKPAPAKASNPTAKQTPAKASPPAKAAPKKAVLAAKGAAPKAAASAKVPAKKNIPVSYELLKSDDYQKYDLYKVQVLRPEKKGFGVQIASFSLYENVLKKIAELQGNWFENVLVKVEESKNKKPVYKIILGPFLDQKTATSYKKNIKKKHKLDGFIVDLSKK